VTLDSRAFSYWSITAHDWALEAGEFEIAVGASSRDLRVTTVVDLPAPSLAPPLGEMSTLEEWLADPAGRAVLLAAAGTDEAGRPLGPLADENLVKVIGSFPMATLAAFPNLGFDHDALRKLVEQVHQR
jgi:beta-glucosidase